MKPICWITVLALAQLCALVGSDSEHTRPSLIGITALDVVVEGLSEGASKIGLTQEAIQTDVELKLRLAGMRIAETSSEYLYVQVTVMKDGSAAAVVIGVVQPVMLARNPSISIANATTWSNAMLTTHYSAQEIRGVIRDLVDSFLNAWLSVNPKK